jgi:hypothetical protein
MLTAYWRYGRSTRFDSEFREVGLLWKFALGALWTR